MKAFVKSTRVFDNGGIPLTSCLLVSKKDEVANTGAYLNDALHQVGLVILEFSTGLRLH